MSPRRRRSNIGTERFEPAPLEGPLLDVKDLTTYFKTPHGLARARLADDTECATAFEGERDAVDGPGETTRRLEVGGEILDVEEWPFKGRRLEALGPDVRTPATRAHRALSRTSNFARSASPR